MLIRLTALLLRWEWLLLLALAPLFIVPLAVPVLAWAAFGIAVGLLGVRVVARLNRAAFKPDAGDSVALFATVLDVPLVLLLLTLPGAAWAAADWEAFIPALSRFLYGVLMFYATVRCWRMCQQRQVLIGLTALGVGIALIGLFTMRSPAQKLPLLQTLFDLIPRIKPPAALGSTSNELGGFFHPNILAITLAMLLPFGLATGRTLHGLLRAACLAGCAVMGLVLLLTVSRTAIGALVVSVLIVGGFRWRWLWGLGMGLAVVGALLAWQFGLEVVLGGNLSSATEVAAGFGGRSDVWRGAWQTLLDFPFLPAAFGSFNAVAKSPIGHLQKFLLSGWDFHAHNIFLEYAVNFGVLGFAAVITLTATLVGVIARKLRTYPDAFQAAAIISLLAFFLFGIVDALSPLNKTGFLFFVILAIVAVNADARLGSMFRRPLVMPLIQILVVATLVGGIMGFQFRASPVTALQENVGLALLNQAITYGSRQTFNDDLNRRRIEQADDWLTQAKASGSPTVEGYLSILHRIFANLKPPAQTMTTSLHIAGGDLRLMQALGPPNFAFGAPVNPGGPALLWWQGRASVPLNVPNTARYTITIRTQHVEPAPILLELGADNQVIRAIGLGKGDQTWEEIAFQVDWSAGLHTIDVWFVNDGVVEGKDRNAVVESIQVEMD